MRRWLGWVAICWLLAPPVSGIGSLAWLTPPLLVLGGLALLAVLIFDWRRRGAGPTSSAKMPYVWRVRSEVGADVTME
jgi:hypothetical protein